jgi:hypothetical protein
MAEWFSIEVVDGPFAARSWSDAYGDALVLAGQFQGATDWEWRPTSWGMVFEIELPDEAAWEAFRADPAVQAALDAVPDPVNGLILHRGRGGSSGARDPRRPRPLAGAGAASLPVPEDHEEAQASTGTVTAVLERPAPSELGPAAAVRAS